jgi:uncharacterized protein YpmS
MRLLTWKWTPLVLLALSVIGLAALYFRGVFG